MTRAMLLQLARRSLNMTGADIERTIREARIVARRQSRELTFKDLTNKLTHARPQFSDDMRWHMAVHEAGHVLVKSMLGVGRITLVTIDGSHGLAYVASENDDRSAQTEAGAMDMICAQLAGRAAKELLLGHALTGSGGTHFSDLARATEIAYLLEYSAGFGSKQRLVYRDRDDWQRMLAINPTVGARLDERLEEAFARATKLIDANKKAHEFIAKTILAYGTLEGPPLQAMLGAASIMFNREEAN